MWASLDLTLNVPTYAPYKIAHQTKTLTKGFSSGCQSRIINLYQKIEAWMEARRAKETAIENLRALRQHQT
jgi:Holliday junction resolvasome RuvABC endonuclease subunit